MLHVILLILKIVGIILLGILGLILLLLLAVLFAAISYQVRVQKGDAVHVSASAGWLFRIISVHFQMDMEEEMKQDLKICIFGIPILKPLEEKPKKTEKPKKVKKKAKASEAATEQAAPARSKPVAAPKEPEAVIKELKPAPAPSGQTATAKSTAPKSTAPEQEEMPRSDQPKKKESIFKKIRGLFHKIDLAIENIKDKIRNIRSTIQGILEKKDKYLGFLNQEDHKKAEKAALKELLYILKKIRPRKLTGHVHFGFEDPATTGQAYGAACVFYAWYPKGFELRPDFEQEVIECDVRLKGKIRLYVFVGAALSLLLNKDIRAMYKDWKRL